MLILMLWDGVIFAAHSLEFLWLCCDHTSDSTAISTVSVGAEKLAVEHSIRSLTHAQDAQLRFSHMMLVDGLFDAELSLNPRSPIHYASQASREESARPGVWKSDLGYQEYFDCELTRYI
jgi:hypothetical protein